MKLAISEKVHAERTLASHEPRARRIMNRTAMPIEVTLVDETHRADYERVDPGQVLVVPPGLRATAFSSRTSVLVKFVDDGTIEVT